MRIKLSEEVYNLIHSLSSTEKAYFKKQNASTKESNLVIAFDIVNSSKKYDEGAIATQMKDKKISSDSIYKRLLPALLKSMAHYQSGNTTRLQLNEILSNVEFLFSKELFKLCNSQIQKGLEIATTNELFPYQMELLAWQQKLMIKRVDLPTNTEFELVQQTSFAADNQKKQTAYKYLFQKLFSFTQVERISASERASIISEILGHELMLDETKSLPSIEVQRERVKALAYFFTGQWEESLIASKAIVESTPDVSKLPYNAMANHFSVLINIAQLNLGLYDSKGYIVERDYMIGLLKKTDEAPAIIRNQLEQLLHQLNLVHLINSGQLNVALETAMSMTKDVAEGRVNAAQRKAIMIGIPYAYFLQEKYSNVIAYINKEIYSAEVLYLNDKASWLELLSVFMKGDELVFESKWRSWSRRLKKANSGFLWEGYVMTALKKAFGKPKAEQQQAMKALYQQLLPLEAEMRTSLMSAIDILLWVESIALGKPMAILLKEKYLG